MTSKELASLFSAAALIADAPENEFTNIAKAILKVSADRGDNIYANVLIADPNDIGGDEGKMTELVWDASGIDQPAYFVPTDNGTVSFMNDEATPVGTDFEVGKAYKYLGGAVGDHKWTSM